MSNARELSELAGSYGTGGFVGMKNRIINGAMAIAQRATSATADDGTYPSIDRYQTFTQAADGVFTVAQVADAPAGFTYSAKITVTTADASIGASQRYLLLQNIEGFNIADFGFGTAGAATATVSFWAKSSVTGTFGGCLMNASFGRSYPFNYTINAANTWEYKTVTIAGDTTGTWNAENSVGFRLVFSVGAGSSGSGAANTWASAGYWQPTGSVNLISTLNATLQVAGLQLEKGSTATSFDYRPYGTELALCSRYFQNQFVSLYKNSSGSTCLISDKFHTVMRAAPTVAVISRESTIGAQWDTDRIGTTYVEWGNGTGGEQRQRITYTASAEL